jgi:hypothetical protein
MTLQNAKRLKERWDNSLVEKINERLRAIIFNGANLTRSNLSELVPFPETPAGRIDLRGFFSLVAYRESNGIASIFPMVNSAFASTSAAYLAHASGAQAAGFLIAYSTTPSSNLI